jgi:hypothetical protein
MSDLARPTPAASAGVVSWAAMQQYFPHRRIGTYLRPLPEHDVIYVKNPKAGCSTILVWLDRIHTGDYDFEFTNVHREHRLPKLRDVGRHKVQEMLAGSAYRFSFVRNPLRRFESVYWDKMVHDPVWRHNIPTRLGLDVDPDTVISFEQFLAAVEEQDPVSGMDPHWRPQHVNLMNPLVTYDRIGRLETFEEDLLRVREEAGLPRVPLRLRNVSRHEQTESVYDGRPDLVRRVERIYAVDFELYGY